MGFVHLHVHTEYSLLDGAASIPKLMTKTKELGMDAVAITDHGTMFGVIDFYKEAKKQGLKPIIGCEVYTAARTMYDKDVEKDKFQGHLVLLAKDNQGYQNLMKIVSLGFLEGFYYKPRVDHSVLEKYSKGIIALSACLAGDIQRKLLSDDYSGAKEEALRLQSIFGKDNFYLELQDQGLEEEFKILPYLKKLHEETDIPFVATNDVHYIEKSDANAHDVLICIQTAKNIDEEERMRFPNDEFYLKSPEEMEKLFATFPEAISNTQKIADRCEVNFRFDEIHLPDFTAPNNMENTEYLRNLCEEGFTKRYGEKINAELRNRLEYEFATIVKMDYVAYFLIVWDFINYARLNGIVVGPGRGSAAGSIVAYCLRITDVDPIKYGLIFERFLNPERISMPDIDIDFCYERRQEVINYVIEKYGSDKVAQIITFGTMKAKAAIRDVGRAINMSYGEVDAIAKKVPLDPTINITKALAVNPELRAEYESNEKVKYLIDTALALEGMPRHASTHAAGVVISKKNIDEYVPLYVADKGVTTQFSMNIIEELGLLKMDFLGLRTLTVIRDALELIEKNHNTKIDFSSMEYDDSKVYELISSGNTFGVFQLESSGMQAFLKNLRPDCFEDIVAGVALYRPGPMDSIPAYIENKKHQQKIKYADNALLPILSVTYGCLVYQEQVMQIVRDLAGYTYGRSDLVRRAMSKKKMDVMKEEKVSFVEGCIKNGIKKGNAEEIFRQMEKFAEYAFNKSHAAAYAVLAYQTAYLKTYFPVEFMAALMTSVMGDAHHMAKYIRNCKEMKITILPPDVNESSKKFTVEGKKIRFGLQAIKNVGIGVVDEIEKVREKFGKAKTIFEFIDRLDVHEINKKALESMIQAGALSSLEGNRAMHIAMFERLIESAQNTARKNVEGQISLFQLENDSASEISNGNKLPQIAEFSSKILMSMEKEMLGIYLSGHPLDDYEAAIKNMTSTNTEELTHLEENQQIIDGMKVIMAGTISSQKKMTTKNNKIMSFVQLEDLYGVIEVIVFPNVFERSISLLSGENVIVINGKLNFKEDEMPKLIAESITNITEEMAEHYTKKKEFIKIDKSKEILKLTIKNDKERNTTLLGIQEILKKYYGGVPVVICFEKSSERIKSGKSLCVSLSDELILELNNFLGTEAVNVINNGK